MAIRGSLAEAGLPDVLQLLALGQKTGCLSVARAGDFGSIFFERGRVVHASLVNRKDRLGEMLLRSGAVEAGDLRAALAEQTADPSRRLGELLLRRGAVDARALERQTRLQVEEAVLELFTWAQGTFSFEPEVRVDLPVTPLSIDPSALLLEGARRADERARIATLVPGRDAVFGPAADAPRAADGALDLARIVEQLGAREVELTAGEARVVPLVDGRRDLAQLADAACVVEFEAMRALFVLADAGLVERVGVSAAPDPRAGARLDEHRNLGVAFYRASLFDESVREFRRVLELSPTDGHARFHLGLVALRRGRWAEAAAALGEAAALAGAPAVVFHALALARRELGALVDAHEALDEAARRGLASDVRVQALRASLHLRGGDVSAAQDALRDDAESRGRPAPWYHYAALAAARAGELAGAAELLEAGVAAHPRAASLHANLAALRLHCGRLDDALRSAEAALAEDASLAPAHKTAGDAHYRAGRFAEAAACYERAVALAPTAGADAWLRLGNVRLRQGDRDAAGAAWRRALEVDPAHAIARGNLAALEREVAA
jgi:tetratricopeptide (TPR) repeat protein